MTVTIRVDGISNVESALRRLANESPVLAARALNSAVRRAATRARRDLSNRTGIGVRRLSKTVKAYLAHKEKLRATVWMGRKYGYTSADIRQSSESQRALFTRGDVRHKPFRARTKSGHLGLFTRQKGAKHERRPDGKWTQLPIEEVKFFLNPDLLEDIGTRYAAEQMRDYYPGEFRRLLDLEAGRTARRRHRRDKRTIRRSARQLSRI